MAYLKTGCLVVCAPERITFATSVLLPGFLRSTGANPSKPLTLNLQTPSGTASAAFLLSFLSLLSSLPPLFLFLFLSFIPRSSPPPGNLSQQSQLLMPVPHRKIDVSSFYPLLRTNVKAKKKKKVGENEKGGQRKRKIETCIPTLNTRHAHTHTQKFLSCTMVISSANLFCLCQKTRRAEKQNI